MPNEFDGFEELAKAQQESQRRARRIEQLEHELKELRLEKDIAEERLNLFKKDQEVEKKQLETTLSVSTLKMDWLAAAKELETLKENPDPDLRDALCINFANQLRVGALKDIDQDPDNILVLKATAYETYYRACVATLENRNLRVKLDRRDKFQADVIKEKEKKTEAARDKEIKEKARTPQEKMIQGMMNLGMSRQDAEKQIAALNALVKK